MFWHIICELTSEAIITYREDNNIDSEYLNNEFFNIYYFIAFEDHYHQNYDKAIILTYFSFTSLSTVGFGDFNPRSDFERVICAFILLFGVAIFSYIMGNFIEILDEFKNLNADLD